MKKELIIIVFKIDINGMSKQTAEQQILQLMNQYKYDEDEELKENHVIRQIWLPTRGNTDVKVIYPVSGLMDNIELFREIEDAIDKYPNSSLTKGLNKILREIKLKKFKITE